MEWTYFLMYNPRVTTFRLDYYNFVSDDFDSLLAQLPSLVEMTLWLRGEINIDSRRMTKSLDVCKKLQVFHLISDTESDVQEARADFERMSDKWRIKNIPKGVSFERKQDID